MSNKIFKKYRYDIALQDGVGAHMVSWVSGLMVFFMTLMICVNLGLAALTHEWTNSLSGSLTVEIKPPLAQDGSGKISADQQKAFDDKTQKVLWLSKQHPAVEEGRILPAAEVKALIEPWLGQQASEDIPLPALIDLRLASNADTAKLKKDITDLVPDATIDTHDATLGNINTLVNTVRGFVLLLTGVIVSLAVMAISGIIRAKLSIHRQEVETLHLLGADNEYISRQFRQHTLRGTIKGAIIGVIAMLVTLLCIGNITHTIDSALIPHLKLVPWQWLLVVLSPIAAGAIVAHLTAQVTVMRSLSKLT